MKLGVVLAGLLFFLYVAVWPLLASQISVPQTPLSPEAAQIDQLLKDNRALMAQSKFDEIPPKAEAALALSQKIGDKVRETRARMQVATAAFHLGEREKAFAGFKLAVELAAQVGERSLQSLALNSAASLALSSGLYDEAYYFYAQSRALMQQLKDRGGEAFVLGNMAALFMDTDRLDDAERLLADAWQLTQQLRAEGKRNEGADFMILYRRAGIELQRNRPAAAFAHIQQLLSNETEKTPSAMRMETRLRLGDIYSHLDQFEQATATYLELAAQAQKANIPAIEARAIGSLGRTKFYAGHPAEALPYILQAIEMVRASTKNWMVEKEYLTYLAEIQRALGRHEEALATYRQGMEYHQHLRLRTLPSEEAKGVIVSGGERVYTGAIELLFEMKRPEEALEIAETWHAGAFLDVLAEARIDLRRDLTREQKQREDRLLENIARIQKELWTPNLASERSAALKAELKTAENQLEVLQLELRRTNPRYASLKYPQPIKPAHIAKELLAEGTALIEFVLGEKKSFAWVVRPGKITAVTLPAKKEINAQITQYRSALDKKVSSLTAAQLTAKLSGISANLYQKLFQPLESHLTTVRKLIVVPDGALVYLPFETLVRRAGNSEYLLERFAISYAPSATALVALKRTAARAEANGVIAFGDPIYAEERPDDKAAVAAVFNAARAFDLRNLPNTRREVTEIAALFPRTEQKTFLGAEAREPNVKAAHLDKYRYVHFAAHGVVDEAYPARSGIVLSTEANSKDDGVLQMSEVMRLKLNADLVTLSACRTGLGKLLSGEGMIGLTRAFLYAGADSVVVSLWNVNDMATASLMKSFYQHLQRGLTKNEALRQAKLTMLRGPQRAWQHPYFWAAFVLVGEQQ